MIIIMVIFIIVLFHLLKCLYSYNIDSFLF